MSQYLFTFGLNEDGQCGISSGVKEDNEKAANKNVYKPTVVPFFRSSGVSIRSVSVGSRHTLALSKTGEVYSWGWGHLGQLGHGDNLSQANPRKINSISNVIFISAGGMHCGCITENNICYTWGACNYGQLGIGDSAINQDMISIPTEVKFDETTLCSKITCGGLHTAAITLDGSVYCWGKADSGQTGCPDWYKTFFSGIYSPKKVYGFNGKAIDVACGGFHTLILTGDNSVYAMGKEDFGLLGTGNTGRNMSIGAEVPTLLQAFNGIKITQLSAGGWHSCFVNENGTLFTCGKGEYGRLGQGCEKSKTVPSVVHHVDLPTSASLSPSASLSNPNSSFAVKAVSAGGSHTLICTESDRVFAVGRLDYGRCGVEMTSQPADRICIPHDITHLFHHPTEGERHLNATRQVLQVAAGGSHSAVLVNFIEG